MFLEPKKEQFKYTCRTNNFIRVLYFAKPYWIYAVFNIIFNILAVIFSLVSLTMIIPFLGLLFGTQEKVYQAPKLILK